MAYMEHRVSPADENSIPRGRHFAGGWLGYRWQNSGCLVDMVMDFDYFNDLWRYDPQTNQWTWMKGGMSVKSIVGVMDTKGIPL